MNWRDSEPNSTPFIDSEDTPNLPIICISDIRVMTRYTIYTSEIAGSPKSNSVLLLLPLTPFHPFSSPSSSFIRLGRLFYIMKVIVLRVVATTYDTEKRITD